jgi:uncharacterized protein (AIM24 family)
MSFTICRRPPTSRCCSFRSCRRFPGLRCLALDLPEAVEHARALGASEGMADCDVVFMGNIVHHFDEKKLPGILQRLRLALQPGGIIETVDGEMPVGIVRYILHPMKGDCRVDIKLDGTVAQSARLTLAESETVWASKGSILAHAAGLKWDIRIPGGLTGALKRSLSGEGISLTYIEATAADQFVMLGANAPGHIEEWNLDASGPVLTTRGAFLAAWGAAINITVAIARRPGAALFGGSGLVLQRIEGSGSVLVRGRGDFRKTELADGEELRVSTGNLAAFSDTVDYNIESVGSLRKSFFSKEGLFMTRLTGPGTVLLQTLKARPSEQS